MIFNTHLYDSPLIVNNFMINNKCDGYKTLKRKFSIIILI